MAPVNGSKRVVVAVVLNYCREADTVACVQALEGSVGVELSVLIVDNGSPDGSGGRLQDRFPQHDFLQTGANLGYAGGNALGMARALGRDIDYLLVLNEDTEVAADMLIRLVEAVEAHPQAGAAAPLMVHEGEPPRVWWGGGTFDRIRALATHDGTGALASEVSREPPVREVSSLCGCCILFRAGVLRAVGGFASDYDTYGEDVELSLRLTRAGHQLLFVPGARIVHKVAHPEPPPTPRKIRLRDRNRRRIVRRHYGIVDRLCFAAWFYPTRGVHAVRYLLRGDWDRLGAIWAGVTEP